MLLLRRGKPFANSLAGRIVNILSKLPRRPSELINIKDPLDALLFDIEMITTMPLLPEIRVPKNVPKPGKKIPGQSTKAGIMARRRQLGIPSRS